MEPELDYITEDERKFIKEASYFESMALSPGWVRLKLHMKDLVDASSEDLQRNMDPTKDTSLRMRWQQRGYMMDTLIQYVETAIERKKEILEQAKENYDVEHHNYSN